MLASFKPARRARGGRRGLKGRAASLLVGVVALSLGWPAGTAGAAPVTFGSGSLVIPMDVGPSGQDTGMLRAYGLVYSLLRNGVPVHWSIDPAKSQGGNDFTIAAGTVTSLETGAAVSLPRSYRGGPFLVHPADRAAALPIVDAWLASDSGTVVHDVQAGSATVEIARTLLAAPRIGILRDDNESIAFTYLNAAGITDSTGAAWNASSPDLLTEAEIAGAAPTGSPDGVLLGPGNLPRYCHLASMHYNGSMLTPAVVREVRAWLEAGPLTHAFMQCAAITPFENDPSGRFLTTAGVIDDGTAPSNTSLRLPSDPLSQVDGAFGVDVGTVDSIGLAPDSSFRPGVSTLINEASSPLVARIVMLSGPVDGSNDAGTVSYLAGHDYSVAVPVSTNPQTNGARLFLNALLASLCAATTVQPDLELSIAAPDATRADTITYTVSYTNPGPRTIEHLRLRDELPAGTTFVSATGGGTHTAGVVTWELGSLAADASGFVTVTVAPNTDGQYMNVARAGYAHLAVRRVTTTHDSTVDTVAPPLTIDSGPAGAVGDATPTFAFSSAEPDVTFACRLDSAAFAPCESPHTTIALVDGEHTFHVRATDAAGNANFASRTFTIDTRPVQPDRDADGAPDTIDACPDQPAATTTGCPAAVPPAPDLEGPMLLGRTGLRGTIRVNRRGYVRLTIGRFDEDADGLLRLQSAEKLTSSAPRKRILRLGRKRFSARTGTLAVVTLRLSAAHRRLLGRMKRMEVRAKLRAADRVGNTSASTYRFALKAPRRSRA